MTKRGAEKIISVYWFVIIFLVAAAIVYMVYVFYGKPYDVREIETNLLADKIADCLSRAGYIKDNWQAVNSENILAQCGLNFNVEDTEGWNDDQYFSRIKISSFTSEQILSSISVGNQNLESNCGLEGETSPVCVKREMYSIDKANVQYRIEILSVVRKTEKNA